MRYRLIDIPVLVRTSLGRKQLFHGVMIRMTPLFVLWARVYRRFFINTTNVTAVIGSFGKTTTARCILAALDIAPHASISGNSGICLARNILRIKSGTKHAVVEVGISGTGQMRRNAAIVKPDIVVVTSIGSEHNRSFGTLEVTREEKANMVRALDETGLAVLNGDDPNVLWMRGQTRAKVVTFGFGPDNDFRASDVHLQWPSGTSFKVHAGADVFDVVSPLVGRPMVYPILAAAVLARHKGRDLKRCFASLAKLEPYSGRLQPVFLDNGAIVVRDEYKSAPETIYTALDLLADVPAERKIVVMGEVNEPPGKQGDVYRRAGERIGEIASRAFFVCSKRSFRSYSSGAVFRGMSKDRLHRARTDGLLELIELLRSEVKAGDVLLLKGREGQRLERIAFALQGRAVKCDLGACDAKSTSCDNCPVLGEGWAGRKIVF